jgi:Tfp pilus assembly PilM family ATPase
VDVGKAVTNLTQEKIAEALSDLLRETTSTTKQAGISIPLNSSIISTIGLPQVYRKQLQEMVPLEARKYVPVPISEVSLDWSVLPKDESKNVPTIKSVDIKTQQVSASAPASVVAPSNFSGQTSDQDNQNAEKTPQPVMPKMDVLVAAIHNEALKKYQNIANKSGLSINFFEIEVFSTMRAVLDSTTNAAMIFDMGASSTKIYIVENGIIRSSHSIDKGSQDITNAIAKAFDIPFEKAEVVKRSLEASGKKIDKEFSDIVSLSLEYIFSEANRLMLGFEQKYSRPIEKIVLTGGGVGLKGFADLARSNFKSEVVMADPFSKIETPAFLENTLKKIGPEFAVACGGALRGLQEL